MFVVQPRRPFPLGTAKGVIGPLFNTAEGLRYPSGIAQPGQPFSNVVRVSAFSYLEDMEVHFNPDLQARLSERAAQQGRGLDETVQDVVARYFEEEDRFIEAVKRGEAAFERGEFLTHEQMGERLRRFLQP